MNFAARLPVLDTYLRTMRFFQISDPVFSRPVDHPAIFNGFELLVTTP